MIWDFWQSSEAVGLSQVSKMLRQLTGQISAHYPSSKIRNTHLRLFRPDQGSHTVQLNRLATHTTDKTFVVSVLNIT